MNFASWVILGVVVLIVALAVKATFFKKGKKGGCCDVGDSKPAGCGCPPAGCSACSACCGMRIDFDEIAKENEAGLGGDSESEGCQPH